MGFTQPLCGTCWDRENHDWAPVVSNTAEIERCCQCGEKTESGIYIRVDPATVPFPKKEV